MSEAKSLDSKMSFGTEADAFIKILTESLIHPFYIIDAETHEIVLANSASYKGRDSTAKTCHLLTHQNEVPCDSVEHGCPLKEVKRTGEPVTVIHTHYDLEGNAKLFEVHGYPITRDGKITHMIEYSIDITDRKRAEEEATRAINALEDNTRLQSELIQAQKTVITELSTPIIEIWESLLVLPVVGNVNAARGTEITSAILNRVSEKRAHGVIIDVTGIEAMDTTTAAQFIKMTKSIRLLGAIPMISGISPQISEILVQLDVELGGAVTHSTLKDALRWFISRYAKK
ncbi:MAG: hypothetical protein C0600_16690 [Ignavibacteria bacterium]|nr:MAG: hypothetical protein C0600_16690 [Ignavibacteria bacterium]